MTQMNTDEPDEETYAILGAAMEVHSILGHGFLEAVYQSALAMEFSTRGVPFQREAPLTVAYKGAPLGLGYRIDFLCYESIIVELKAQTQLSRSDYGQAINYLKASGFHRALLINFGSTRLEYKRVVF
jgi:GxxExxY protein